MSTTGNFNYLFKYIIIGDSSVGKSNLLLRYCHNRFNLQYQATIGVEFGAKNIEKDGKILRVQVWDTAGQENFRSITRAYYKNSVCAIIVYDITNRSSFKNVQTWIDDCKCQSPKTVFLVLVGNKNDLDDMRVVKYEEGEEFAKKNQMLFFETSAKEGTNVENLFEKSALEITKKIEEGYYNLSGYNSGIKIGGNSNFDEHPDQITVEEKGCC